MAQRRFSLVNRILGGGDVDFTGSSNNDLIFRSGGEWIDTAGLLTWDGSDLSATSIGGITEANLLDKSATETVSGAWTFSDLTSVFGGVTGSNLLDKSATETVSGDYTFSAALDTSAGTESLPGIFFNGDPDTGIFSPGANIWAVTVGGTEAVRYTGASAPLIRYGMTTGITASTTQTQVGGTLITASYNEVSVCANNDDTVTLAAAGAGTMCIIVNNGAKRLQIFPASGHDLGEGIDQPDSVKAGASIFFLSTGASAWFDVATKVKGLLDTDVAGVASGDLIYYDGTNYADTAGLLTWDAAALTLTGTVFITEQPAAAADVGGKGQLWVKNTTPCELWFTDDAGTDTQIV